MAGGANRGQGVPLWILGALQPPCTARFPPAPTVAMNGSCRMMGVHRKNRFPPWRESGAAALGDRLFGDFHQAFIGVEVGFDLVGQQVEAELFAVGRATHAVNTEHVG